jgi:uncharacterized BrkB/YihY/UPF0761 family membrane protein
MTWLIGVLLAVALGAILLLLAGLVVLLHAVLTMAADPPPVVRPVDVRKPSVSYWSVSQPPSRGQVFPLDRKRPQPRAKPSSE